MDETSFVSVEVNIKEEHDSEDIDYLIDGQSLDKPDLICIKSEQVADFIGLNQQIVLEDESVVDSGDEQVVDRKVDVKVYLIESPLPEDIQNDAPSEEEDAISSTEEITKDIQIECDSCNYKTWRIKLLKRHTKMKHSNVPVFQCQWCEYKSVCNSHLKDHVNSQHTKEEFVQCQFCDHKSNRKSDLTKHVNAKHNRKEIFLCQFCDYTCGRRYHLKNHVNCKHTKQEVFKCDHCPYKSCLKNNLKQHVNARHTRATLFTCEFCDHKVTYKQTLKRHIAAKHKDRVYIEKI